MVYLRSPLFIMVDFQKAPRTQVLSSRWRQIWRSAPLNLALDPYRMLALGTDHIFDSLISRILSAHQGPGRRFFIPNHYSCNRELGPTTLDGWLQSPALDGLQELEFHYRRPRDSAALPPPPPESLSRFSSTLRVACFGCCGFPDGNGLRFPVLRQLTLSHVICSESSLRALLAACPVLQSLLLIGSIGCPRLQISCPTLRSIGVCTDYGPIDQRLQQLIVEDAPSLETLLCFDDFHEGITISISVISAPKLHVLGKLSGHSPRLQIGSTVFQGSSFVSLNMVVHSVKILSLKQKHLSLDVVIEFMKCFPCLEKLCIQTKMAGDKNVWCHKYRKLIGTLDIRLKEIVLTGYRGNTSHANFAKFFVLNARMLESMKLGTIVANPSNAWIEKQHRLLQIENKASSDMQLDFVSGYYGCRRLNCSFLPERVHDLSTADPFRDR